MSTETSTSKDASTTKKEYSLDKDCELRFEIDSKVQVTVEVSSPKRQNCQDHQFHNFSIFQLKSGFAELFGTELVKAKRHTFHQGAKVAIFTYHGCVLSLTGSPDICYIARETPMIQYLNTHSAIEQMRKNADEDGSSGPVTMICGPTDVGKSSLCRILLNYAVRLGHRPIFSDIDVGQGSISIPGTMCSLLIERPASIEEGFSQQAPMVVHFGHKNPDANNELYKTCVTTLAEISTQRLNEDRRTNCSGIIVNTVSET